MGLFSNLFSKKNTAAAQPQPVQMPEEKKPRYIVKSQRFILDNVKDHMEDIMDLVEKNEDYKLKKKDLIEENREDENIYEYELNEKATITTISCEGGGEHRKQTGTTTDYSGLSLLPYQGGYFYG